MAEKRVLFFGVTGVDKRAALSNIADWASRHLARENICQVDFDRDYVFNSDCGGQDWYAFLNENYARQRASWCSCWERFVSERVHDAAGDLFVGMHGCFVRGHYGVRWIVEPQRVAESLRPNLLVVLIDDVYDMWWRTESRAGGEDYRGRPTLEQLLFARRCELMIADQIAHCASPPTPVFLVSVKHPSETVCRRIYASHPKVLYLAFPISAPRDLVRQDNDRTGMEEVNSFVQAAYERQHRAPDIVVCCPLGVDELPLVDAMDDSACHKMVTVSGEDVDSVRFDRPARRWNVGAFWNPADRISRATPSEGEQVAFPLEQVQSAAGLIRTDVGWRDYRLVDQANYMIAFNPKFRNRTKVSRSVFQEINFFATGKGRPVYVMQDPKHDPDGVLDELFPEPGTMQEGPGSQMVIRKDSVDEALAAVTR